MSAVITAIDTIIAEIIKVSGKDVELGGGFITGATAADGVVAIANDQSALNKGTSKNEFFPLLNSANRVFP